MARQAISRVHLISPSHNPEMPIVFLIFLSFCVGLSLVSLFLQNSFNLLVKIVNKKKAKETMRLYIEGQLEMYKDILGEEENFDSSTLSGLTVQDLEEAFKVIKPLLL